MMEDELIKKAKQAREKAYVPYSKFKVGAALLGKSGTIYTGCNIENSSFSLTCCAERNAIFKAISEGEKSFEKMAVIADTTDAVSPCGACRQVMVEFFTKDTNILLSNMKNNVNRTTAGALLPFYFSL
ncbi:MAG TPA: cytidine deaminase [Pseudogracilibacillus sp.]|nr:cytidine deaminase [Pseudogracilibacillus sp.]